MSTATDKPADPLYRSSYAIKRELEPGLKKAVAGLRLSLAEFLSMVAEDPEGYIALLSDRAAKYRVSKALAPRPDSRTREDRKKLQEIMRNADPDTLKRMIALANQGQEQG